MSVAGVTITGPAAEEEVLNGAADGVREGRALAREAHRRAKELRGEDAREGVRPTNRTASRIEPISTVSSRPRDRP